MGVAAIVLAAAVACRDREAPAAQPNAAPPASPMTLAEECVRVTEKIRESLAPQLAEVKDKPQLRIFLETSIRTMKASCEEDGWPAALKACILGLRGADPAAIEVCNRQMPPELQQRMQDRLQRSIQLLTRD